MDAVLLGLLAGALFGAMTIAVRAGLLRGGDAALGGVVITGSAFVVAAFLALPSVVADGLDLESLWPFAAVGLFVPGLSQLLFILAVRHAGPSRAAILVGTAPLGSVLLAMALLDEPLRPALLVGTALIVAGGAALALDPGRPAGYRTHRRRAGACRAPRSSPAATTPCAGSRATTTSRRSRRPP